MMFSELAINDHFICYPLEEPECYHFVFKKVDRDEPVLGMLALCCNEGNRIALYGINALRLQDNLGMSIADEDPVIKVEL